MTIRPSTLAALQPALDAGYTAELGLGPEITGIDLYHDALPDITVWGTESADVVTNDVYDFKGPDAVAQAVAFAKGERA